MIHQGAILGIEIASKIAVKTTDPSAIAGLISEPRNLKKSASVIRPVMQAKKIWIRTDEPKKYTCAATPNARA
jgi:hypothetical protein